MGYMVHHAIIVTGEHREEWHSAGYPCIDTAHDNAVRLAANSSVDVSEITSKTTNGYCSFMVAPDGSKAGWESSAKGDQVRAAIIEWLKESGHFSWAEVQYGDEDGDDRLLQAG